jgi:hypothetical protein
MFLALPLLVTALTSPLLGMPILALAVFGAYRALRPRRLDDARVVFDDEGIRLEGTRGMRRVRRSEVMSGFDDPEGRATVLALANGVRCELSLNDPLERERVLVHLGQTIDQRALVAPLRGMLGAFTRGVIAFCLSLVVWSVVFALLTKAFGPSFGHSVGHSPAIMFILSALVTLVVVQRVGSPRVVIGTDGLRLEGRLIHRFVPFSRVASVHEMPAVPNGMSGVVVLLTGGGRVVLPTVAQTTAQVNALVERIREGRRRYEASGGRSPTPHLERGGRTMKAWRSDLAQQLRPGGFRQASIDAADLERVVENPAVPLERRVGAVLALRELADDSGALARVRVTAGCAADERVRVALEEAAADELDETRLDRALDHSASGQQ